MIFRVILWAAGVLLALGAMNKGIDSTSGSLLAVAALLCVGIAEMIRSRATVRYAMRRED